MIIHLFDEKNIVIPKEETYRSMVYEEMNNRNDYVKFGNFIISKTSINFIEFIEEESEENN